MDDLRALFFKSGLTLQELSNLSGVSVSTIHRYVNNKTKDIDGTHYSAIYKALEQHESTNSKSILGENQIIEVKISKLCMDYLILSAEKNMYKLFHDQFVEAYKEYIEMVLDVLDKDKNH